MKLLLLLLLQSNSFCQTQDEKSFAITAFNGGLNTHLSPLSIGDNEAQIADNVVFDESNSIQKRKGIIKVNQTAIGGGSSDIKNLYYLQASNGTNYCVAFSSTSGYFSTDDCVTFTVFISTLTKGNDVNCDNYNDALYCANGIYAFYWNAGASVVTTLPQAPSDIKYIRVHKNRCFSAGASTNFSRVYWSVLGNCNSWNTSIDFVDVDSQNGDVITALGLPIFDMLPVYKNFSTWVLKGSNPNNFVLSSIDKTIGCKNQSSIGNLRNVQIFDSLGANSGLPGLYQFNGVKVSEVSEKIREDFSKISQMKSGLRRVSIDSKSDFDAGTFDPRAMSSSRENGIMESSFSAFTDAFNAFTSSLNISTSITKGIVTLQVDTNTATLYDDFNDGDYTNNPTWTFGTGTNNFNVSGGILHYSITSCPSTYQEGDLYSKSNQLPYGSWRITLTPPAGNLIQTTSVLRYSFLMSGTDRTTANGYYISIRFDQVQGKYVAELGRIDAGSLVVLASFLPGINVTDTPTCVFSIFRDESGNMKATSSGGVSCAGSATVSDNKYSTGLNWDDIFEGMDCNSATLSLASSIDNVNIASNYLSPGNFTSQSFDTAISTPIWGPFNVTFSSPSSSNLTFQTQVSSDNSNWDSLVSATAGSQITSASKRYIRYKPSFSTTVSSVTPTLSISSFTAASTGTWTSKEMYLSNSMSSWGLFQTVQSISGAQASIAYCLKTSTFPGGTTNAACNLVTPGSTISSSTGIYAVLFSTFTIGVATETAKLDTAVINWSEGANATAPSSIVFKDRYHYGFQSSNGSLNDLMYVLDGNGAFSRFTGILPRSMMTIGSKFYIGSSSTTSGGFIYQMYQGDSDNSSPILAEWKSKEYSLGNLTRTKSFDRLYLVYAANPTTPNLALSSDYGSSTASFPVNMSSSLPFSNSQNLIATPINGKTFSLDINDNSINTFGVLGVLGYYRDLGLSQ